MRFFFFSVALVITLALSAEALEIKTQRVFLLWPEGKSKAVTFSYDDGGETDFRLLSIFNKYGIRGTFHVNANIFFDDEGEVKPDAAEKIAAYNGHEIASHGWKHMELQKLNEEVARASVVEDRRALEFLTSRPIIGFAYPYGSFNGNIKEIVSQAGMVYSRTVDPTNRYDLPGDFMEWRPTCHHKDKNIMEKTDIFLGMRLPEAKLYLVWGHSYEFDEDKNWEVIEEVCKKLSGKQDIWYATCIEVYEYMTAYQRLEFSFNCTSVKNPSATAVWLSVNSKPVKIMPGETVCLASPKKKNVANAPAPAAKDANASAKSAN